jgi:hypothetical protein
VFGMKVDFDDYKSDPDAAHSVEEWWKGRGKDKMSDMILNQNSVSQN